MLPGLSEMVYSVLLSNSRSVDVPIIATTYPTSGTSLEKVVHHCHVFLPNMAGR